jgi:hypothetical protein
VKIAKSITDKKCIFTVYKIKLLIDMPVFIDKDTESKEVLPGVHRKLVHLENIMSAIIDFTDGPMSGPDPPHSHPH